ncbi:heterokaryon incompatibility protein-domain-containing protein [Flammula alnicola]|nr:heterokaryon incompatibility protein-domain-containing protein [Flammula alnicola]
MRKKVYCPFCRLVLTALGGSAVPSFEDGKPVSVVMSWNTDGRTPDPNQPWNQIPEIRILMPYAQTGKDDFLVQRFFRPINQRESNRLCDGAKLDIDVRKLAWNVLQQIRDVSSCGRHPHPTDAIPSFRLIDVEDNCIISAPKNPKYAALSYLWGQADFLKTLKRNVDTLSQPGALMRPEFREKMSRTVLDAMQVVRELNLRYLWVDSLCMIQDDATAGHADSVSKMDIVYGASFITIIAATGVDANAGLPGVRPGTRGQRQCVEEIAPGFRLAFKEFYQNYIKDSVYYTRAWPFQEQLFTPRSLIFIGGQVAFKCSKAEQWREDVVFEDESILTGTSGGLEDTSSASNDIGEFEGLIQSYSGLSLTYDFDIYNAFAGVANRIKSKLKVDLCHGIPDAYFDWFLLWTSLAPQVRRKGARAGRGLAGLESHGRGCGVVAHGSTECVRVWNPTEQLSSSSLQNFYGGAMQTRFPFDCNRTLPTLRTLVGAPEYFKDILNSAPRSGFLQFWTVSVTFNLGTPTSIDNTCGPTNTRSRVGFFGRDGHEVGTLFVNESWLQGHVPGHHEFILLCEGRDQRAKHGKSDGEDGWKYMAMLIEWHEEWAERVSVGSIEKHDLEQSLEPGPVWKEIILA